MTGLTNMGSGNFASEYAKNIKLMLINIKLGIASILNQNCKINSMKNDSIVKGLTLTKVFS